MNPARTHDVVRPRVLVAAIIALAPLCLLIASPAAHAQPRSVKPAHAAEAKAPDGIDAEKLFGAIVKVSVHAIPDARSASSLGTEREGTGIVSGDNGLILTIGYLIVEAEEVNIVDIKGRTLAAQVVGYDHASGFGILRTISPFDAKPVTFGDSAKVAEREPVMIPRPAMTTCRSHISSASARFPAIGNMRSTRRSRARPRSIDGAALLTKMASPWRPDR
jgi:S1-C subfamily serine protease